MNRLKKLPILRREDCWIVSGVIMGMMDPPESIAERAILDLGCNYAVFLNCKPAAMLDGLQAERDFGYIQVRLEDPDVIDIANFGGDLVDLVSRRFFPIVYYRQKDEAIINSLKDFFKAVLVRPE